MVRSIAIAVFVIISSASSFAGAETNSEVLDKVWAIGHEKSCSKEMRAKFDSATLTALKSQLTDQSDRQDLSRILNPFLFSLGYSHTQFFTTNSESYYLFKGYYSEIDPNAPPPPMIINPGIQVGSDDRGFFAREVLDGFPAKTLGILKGDRILSIDGVPFSGTWGYQAKQNAVVKIARDGQIKDIHLNLPSLNWSQAFQDATIKSIQMIPFKGRTIGYVRLWSGVHPESADALWKAVRTFKAANVDGVILDLRGGYGGAFWSHLDPFFADRNDYFVMSAVDGDDHAVTSSPDPQVNPEAYLGSLVVLTNEGSRSGKEALAYQFKKSRRARLVGTKTAGYFSGGGLFFMDQPTDYFLYLCVMRDSTLDGTSIEGIGISPDVTVEFDSHNDLQDSQLKVGLEQLL